MPKQINVKLGFQADTSQAQQQIQALQQQLNKLVTAPMGQNLTGQLGTEISKAQQSILKLQNILNNSVNLDTGKLNLSKFSQELSKSGLSLQQLSTNFSKLGSAGDEAFLSLSRSIVNAQKPMIESNKLLDNMWTTLKNTARWQLSSSILHGFIGSLQSAYSYAQDLNKSLNSIRIVSGQSTDQMAKFADQANKAAQSLNTSTLAYTDAALIFYQQGLEGEEVNQRVETVLKMSNVTGESADEVSSYMTAIWNNFDDGTESLESYADKITALGAATASSSQEIANGMQQFAAVADTVGLSYDYAATALATVVAQTRQSESTVGNSFRTIFSRLQGLKLGETLEDGTDLNKYSEALSAVGVNIKDQNGQLKDMDTILDEIGAKWKSLAKDQQIALAQTVGGVRQYTNLVALFENWGKFQENLTVTQEAEGELQRQADIYAEGWQAAKKEVLAAWQAIYQDLLKDNFFIDFNKGLANILKFIDSIIDSMGGLKGLLPGILALLMSWKPEAFVSGLERIRDIGFHITGIDEEINKLVVYEDLLTLIQKKNEIGGVNSSFEQTRYDNLIDTIGLYTKINDAMSKSVKITEDQLNYFRQQNDLLDKQTEIVINLEKNQSKLRADRIRSVGSLVNQAAEAPGVNSDQTENNRQEFQSYFENFGHNEKMNAEIEALGKSGTDEYEQALQELTNKIYGVGKEFEIPRGEILRAVDLLAKEAENSARMIAESEKRDATKKNIESDVDKMIKGEHPEKTGDVYEQVEKSREELEQERIKLTELNEELKKDIEELTEQKNYEEKFILEPNKLQVESAEKNIKETEEEISKRKEKIELIEKEIAELKKLKQEEEEKFASDAKQSRDFLENFGEYQKKYEKMLKNGASKEDVDKQWMKDNPLEVLDNKGLSAKKGWATRQSDRRNEEIQARELELQNLNAEQVKAEEELQKNQENFKNFSEQVDNANNSIKQLDTSIQNENDSVEVNKGKIEDINEALGKMPKANPLKKKVFGAIDKIDFEGIEKGARSISQITMAISSLSTALKTLNDKDLTPIEKLKGIISSTAMGLPMLISGLKNLATAFVGTETIAKGFTATLSALFSNTWFIALAAIAVLVVGITRQMSKLADEAKKAKQEAEEARQAYNDLKTSYDNLYSSIEDYKSSRDAIDELKKGTVEWQEEVEELNNKVLELLDTYPELAKYINSENGILTIDTENIDEFLKERRKEIREANLEKINTSNNSRRANLNVSKQELRNALGSSNPDTAEPPEWLSSSPQNTTGYTGIGETNLNKFINKIKEDSSILGDDEKIKKVLEEIGIVNESLVQDFIQHRDDLRKYANELKTVEDSGKATIEAFDISSIQQELGPEITNLLSSKGIEFLEDDIIKKYSQELRNRTENGEDYEEVLSILAENLNPDTLSEKIEEIREENKNKIIEAIQNSEFNGQEDLIEGLDDYQISVLLNTDLSKIEDFEGFIEDLKEQHDIQVNINLDDLAQTKIKKVAELKEEVQTLSKYLKENVEDIDALDNHLAHCDKSLEKIAYSVIRFDDAIQDVTENYDEWMTILSSDSDLSKAKLAAESLTKVYGNLLDIDGSILDKSFLEDTKNLELLKQAIEGSENAYNTLFETVAKKQIIGKIDFDDTYSIDKATSLFDRIQQAIGSPTVTIGTKIEDEEIISELNHLINATAMTAEEAEKMLHDAYNINANVTEHEIKTVDTLYDQQMTPEVTDNVTTEVPGIGTVTGYILRAEPIPRRVEKTQKVLSVESAEKGSGANNFKYKQATHGGGGVSPSKKSGSSTPKAEKPVKKTKENEEKDRYHDIKEAIDDLNTSLERLNKNRERAFGKQRLKYMDQEIQKTKDQIKLTQKYIDEIKSYQKLDRGKLEGMLSSMGLSDAEIAGQFDENGVLKSYENIFNALQESFNKSVVGAMNQAEDEYNAAVQAWNASSRNDSAKEALDAAKERYQNAQNVYKEQEETFKKQVEILKQYEETVNLLQEKQQELIDQQNKVYDLVLERIDTELEFKLSLEEDDRKLLEWVFKYIGDSADYAADKIANLTKQFKTYENDIASTSKALSDIFAEHGIVNIDFTKQDAGSIVKQLEEFAKSNDLPMVMTQAEVDQIRDYMEKLMNDYDQLEEKANEIHETLMEQVDEWLDRIDKENAKFDTIEKKLRRYLDMIDLVGAKALGVTQEELNGIYDSLTLNAKNQMEVARATKEALEKDLARAREEMEKAVGEESRKRIQKDIDELEEKVNDAAEAYAEAWQNAAEVAKDAMMQKIDLSIKYAEDAFGRLGLELSQEEFARQRELEDLYLPDYKKFSDLNKSTNQLKKSLQDTNNAMIKGKMYDLLDEINAKMASGVEMSETETGIIERRVALLQAEAQLRDAQNAKSAVRMTRDNEGNFSYTYTADQDAIDSASENYQEKFRELMEFEQNAIRQNEENLINLMNQRDEAIQEAYEKYGEDEAKLEEALNEIYAFYDEKMQYHLSQLGILNDEQARLRDEDWQNMEQFLGLRLASEEDFTAKWSDLLFSRITGYETEEEFRQNWADNESKILTESANYWDTWQKNIAEITEGFKNQFTSDMEKAQQESNETKDKVVEMADTMSQKFDESMNKVADWEHDIGSKMGEVRNHITQTVDTLNEMIRQLGTMETNVGNVAEGARTAAAALNQAAMQAQWTKKALGLDVDDNGGGSGDGNPDTPDNPNTLDNPDNLDDPVIDDYWTYNSNKFHFSNKSYLIKVVEDQYKYDLRTTVYLYHWQTRKKSGTKCLNPNGEKYTTHGSTSSPWDTVNDTVGDHFSSKFDTGGYTGNWGNSSGKLAVLHSKELVLNKEDTENMLNAVQLVRQIVAPQLSFDLGKGINYNSLAAAGQGGVMEQQVHIDASFPNVQSHTEIELALNNLINSATQYVNRKK